MIKFKHKGNFKNAEKFFAQATKTKYAKILEKYGQEGVNALALATPLESGETANSWDYEVKSFGNSISIIFTNSNIVGGIPLAILLQYGHGTRNGGYVQGRDYINPAIQPIFDKIANEAWREVTQL